MPSLRPSALLFAFLLPALPAQQGQTPPATQQGATTQPASPEAVNRPLTPEERLAELKKTHERLARERAYLEETEKSGGVAGRVKAGLQERRVIGQVTTDKTVKPAATTAQGQGDAAAADTPAAPVRKKARLLGDGEKVKLPKETVFTVDGLPVTQAEFDSVFAYLKSYGGEGVDEQLKSRAVLELVRARTAEAAFAKTAPAAHARIEEVAKALKDGKDFAEVAKAMSHCPSKEAGGDLGTFGREGMDLLFSQHAFSLKVGEVSAPFRSSFGWHIVKVTGVTKGEIPARDTVRASHILALYEPNDQLAVRGVQMRVNQGEVDLAFVSQEWRKYAPELFQ
ncbi:MAG: peptidyl-prolyl cis-trans isomerase [Planctomycetes bacterium]|nr:peptidyl-prolyl cis-trans isomerase [Planctomycetota bacterium]